MKKKKGIFFDFDGVILNSFFYELNGWEKTAKVLGLNFSKENLVALWGLPWTAMLDKIWPGVKPEKFLSVYNKLGFSEQLIPAFPKVNSVLARMKRNNYQLALITNRDRISLEKRLARAGISQDKFKLIQSVDDNDFLKPDPRVFDKALSALKLNGGEVIYLGDTLIDFYATRKTDITFVAVLGGSTPKERFIDIGVKHVIEDIKHLPKIIRKLNQH